MTATASNASLRRTVWAKELWKNVQDELYFTNNGMMGEDENNVVQIINDLSKQSGDTYTFGIPSVLTGAGKSGDDTLESYEEQQTSYAESIAISQIRNAVVLTGKYDEQRSAFDMRTAAKQGLTEWLVRFIEQQVFLKLGGVTVTTLTDVNGVVVGANAAWSNTPDLYPQVDTAAGSGSRYLCACATGADAMDSSDLLTPALISKAKAKAMQANPMIRPLRIDGSDYYIMFVHPRQAYDLKTNSVWTQAQREAQVRGDKNPIFTGALGIWDGVIVHSHPMVPFLDIDVVGNNFNAAGTGTDYAVDAYRALLCGREAVGFAKCKTDKAWVEKEFDYENQVGFSTSLIGGIQKIMFNSLEYGVIAVDTAATAI